MWETAAAWKYALGTSSRTGTSCFSITSCVSLNCTNTADTSTSVSSWRSSALARLAVASSLMCSDRSRMDWAEEAQCSELMGKTASRSPWSIMLNLRCSTAAQALASRRREWSTSACSTTE